MIKSFEVKTFFRMKNLKVKSLHRFDPYRSLINRELNGSMVVSRVLYRSLINRELNGSMVVSRVIYIYSLSGPNG
jgi:hypothetical protein